MYQYFFYLFPYPMPSLPFYFLKFFPGKCFCFSPFSFFLVLENKNVSTHVGESVNIYLDTQLFVFLYS